VADATISSMLLKCLSILLIINGESRFNPARSGMNIRPDDGQSGSGPAGNSDRGAYLSDTPVSEPLCAGAAPVEAATLVGVTLD